MSKENRIASYQRVEKLVNDKGITFYVLAKELNFTRSLFSDWKSGRAMPKTDKLIKIADYLGTTVNYIVGQN